MQAVLRRRHGTVRVVQSVLAPSSYRNISTAPILYAEERDAPRKEGILARIKDIFHRSSDGKGHEKEHDTCDEIANQSEDKPSDRDNILDKSPLLLQPNAFPNFPTKLQIRAMSEFAPRSPNPPIREPNMPEKKSKKDDKKERKRKKPVIRTADQSAAYSTTTSPSTNPEKEMSAEATMSAEPEEVSAAEIEEEKPPTGSSTSLRKILKVSPNLMEETSVTDSDYNVPPGTSYDAELAAWKTLVSRAKVPMPVKEVEKPPPIKTETLNPITIVPEPPEPKLDVQMVRSVDDITKIECDIDDSAQNSNAIESLSIKPSTGIPFKKDTPTKKLHTKAFMLAKNYSTNSDDSSTKTEMSKDNPEKNMDFPLHDKEFSKSSSEPQQLQPLPTDPSLWNNQQKPSTVDDDFAPDTNADKDMEISLSHTHEDDVMENGSKLPTSVTIDARPLKKDQQSESEDRGQSLSDGDYYYASEEDSFDPMEVYVNEPPESTESLPPIIEKPRRKERILKMSESDDQKQDDKDNNSDSEYIRVPGDPYPYSKEHFDKWRRPRENVVEGSTLSSTARKKYLAAKDEYSRAIANVDSSDKSMQDQMPVREMSHDSHAATENYGMDSATALDSMHVMSMMENRDKSERSLHDKLVDDSPPTSRVCMSSLDQRIVPDCLQSENSVDSYAMEQWRSAFSRLKKDTKPADAEKDTR